jgi:hypothetical protein
MDKTQHQTNEIARPAYLVHPEEYAHFKSTRLTTKSNFDILPQDILVTHIQPVLTNIIVTKYKHALLNHNYQEKKDRENQKVLNLITLGLQPEKIFQYYDGTYSITPDIGYNYVMWDESPINKKDTYITNTELECPGEYIQLLCSTKQKKRNFAILFPEEEYFNSNNTHFAIITKNKIIDNYVSKSTITHCVLSNDHEWLIITLQKQDQNVIILFNLHSEKSVYAIKGSLTTLCTAHKSSLFIACNTDSSYIKLINFASKVYTKFKIKKIFDNTPINAEFSPDDKQFIIYAGIKLILFISKITGINKKNIPTKNWHQMLITTENPIRKASFTPDGKLIVLAMSNGDFCFHKNITCKPVTQYRSKWRYAHEPDVDNQAPLLLYSIKNKLLLSLNPASYTSPSITTFFIRKLTNGRILTAYNFYPKGPRAMGLTEDEQSIVFVHPNDMVSLLHLYNDQDRENIDYIQQKTNIYQLLDLLDICKKFKTKQKKDERRNTNASPLVTAVHNYLKETR